MKLSYSIITSVLILGASGCRNSSQNFFTLLPPEKTGISFNNSIEETNTFNILYSEYIYNGGGVGIGDFNNDGLNDLYFAGNKVPNTLYLNRGGFNFENITERACIGAEDIWSLGVSVVDINQDGWMDIYVTASFEIEEGNRKNKLFINQGLTDGCPVFTDQASDFGIDDDSHTTQGIFFDYDMDGDLDLYNLTNGNLAKRDMTQENTKIWERSVLLDKLYRNDGNGKFSEVSREAGIIHEGYGLGIAVVDINKDNFPDVYIANDFISSDVFYINNGDGTFTNQIEKYFKHISYASMGMDASDINNDGQVDILTLDMLPSDIKNIKRMYSTTAFNRDQIILQAGYYIQFIRNCLQYNNGNGTFSDISFLLGISDTDWSWSALFTDFDNDGFKDLAVTNGFPRNITDRDYSARLLGMVATVKYSDKFLPLIPDYKTKNFFFNNHEGNYFEDVSEKWGIQSSSYSNGAAFVDLDNDGDLDYVTNNINEPPFVFKNNLNTIHPDRKWLKLNLEGHEGNINGLGSKISVYIDGSLQYYEHNPYRGYLSSVDPVIHFGLDTCSLIDSLCIQWPSGEKQVVYDIPANNKINLNIENASKSFREEGKHEPPFFEDISDILNLDFTHKELDFIDQRIQPLLPHMHSRKGPGLAVGDINGDKLDDVAVGNGLHADITLFIQRSEGGFDKILLKDTADVEVTGLLLFDYDSDDDLDLYAVSGGSEVKAHSYHYRDRLFQNDGKGNFQNDPQAIPEINISGTVVTAADYDQDGDLDLFIGGNVIPYSYPLSERSVLLQNNAGKFTDVTEFACKELMDLGMVTSALWTDYDQDSWVDLLIAGEWMPARMLKNNRGQFKEVSKEIGLSDTEGWWNSIQSGDFDRDGDIDYVLGNQGLNNRYTTSLEKPIYITAKDFDNNGIVDPIINAWMNGDYYPVHLRNDLFNQIRFMRARYPNFIDYSIVNSDNLFTEDELEGSIELNAKIFESLVLIREENGKYSRKILPFKAQFAPVYGILSSDFNHDDVPDLLMIGNNYSSESFNGAHDAFIGLYLEGDENEDFISKDVSDCGFFVDGDGKSLVSLFDKDMNQLIIASQNADSLKAFKVRGPAERDTWTQFSPEKFDRLITIYNKDGSQKLHELYYGSSYLSQSSRNFLINKSIIEKIIIVDYQGSSHEIRF